MAVPSSGSMWSKGALRKISTRKTRYCKEEQQVYLLQLGRRENCLRADVVAAKPKLRRQESDRLLVASGLKVSSHL